MLNFVKYRNFYYLFSGVIIIAGIISMIISVQQHKSIVLLSVDFVGGSRFEVHFNPVEGKQAGQVREGAIDKAFNDTGYNDVRAQQLIQANANGQLVWQVRTAFVEGNTAQQANLVKTLTNIAAEANMAFDDQFFIKNQDKVSPVVGSEVTTAAVVATFAASFLIMGWIALAFRAVKHSMRYGVCALIAMLHDALVMIGAMSIMGLLSGWEADALFLTGLLTVIGYSVQDTIVVFDRVRENDARHRGEPFDLIVNRSLTETVQRSLMTQIAVAFVLLSLFLIGGGPIHQFVGVLIIGLISGTYSSIFVAVPLLVSWEHGEIPFVNQKARQQKAVA